jgi:outer membrane protein TolC
MVFPLNRLAVRRSFALTTAIVLGLTNSVPLSLAQEAPLNLVPDPELGPELGEEAPPDWLGEMAIELTLSDAILLLLENNYPLKNAILVRIIERQQLREAEGRFDPQIQPRVGVGVSQNLSGSVASPVALGGGSETEILNDGTIVNRAAQLQGTLLTPLGTDIAVTVNPIWSQGISLSITQPLLRGFGLPVNKAPVHQARLQEDQNVLDLENTLIEQISDTILAYRRLIRAQEELRIEQLSLRDQRELRQVVEVLVDVGRRARLDLVEFDANIAATEISVLNRQNAWEQAKSNLLRLLDLHQSLDIQIPQATIETLRQTAELPDLPSAQALTDLAYIHRPDYRQAQLAIEIAELGELVARDDQRWSLDLETNANLQENSDLSAALTLTRVFGDQSRITAVESSRVGVLTRENDLANLTHTIELEVADRLRDLAMARERIATSRSARELAEQRLAIAQIRGGTTFELLELKNNLTTAQNGEVNAKIDLQDTLTELERTVGITLATWEVELETSGVWAE